MDLVVSISCHVFRLNVVFVVSVILIICRFPMIGRVIKLILNVLSFTGLLHMIEYVLSKRET